MEMLNLPTYSFKIKSINNKEHIFDEIRKKYVALTPEEWVRQNFIRYMIETLAIPASLIAVEMSIKLNKLSKRCDIVVYDKNGNAILIVECKAPSIKINQKTFDQITRYNINFKVPYLIVTNGINHYCCKIDYEKSSFTFLEEIPTYLEMSKNI
jgi:hypothetical protein